MKSTLKLLAGACLLFGSSLFVGCGEESSVEQSTTATSPGGETTRTDKTEVKSTGDNPPPAPASPQ